MIVIRIEMWPHGREEGKYELALMTLGNRIMRTITNARRGDYDVKLFRRPKKGKFTDPHKAKPLREGVVEDWPRESYHVAKLVKKAVEALWHED